ncbi:hypothetical protein ACJX0J_040088, partial [Zea mays]
IFLVISMALSSMFKRINVKDLTSKVDTILDKENFTLEELLDEDEIIQDGVNKNNSQ